MSKSPRDINWSHSALAAYEGCPQKYYREKVTKEVPFVETEALKKGNDVHKSMELALGESATPLPGRHKQYQEVVDWALGLPNRKVEEQMAFTADLERCEWFDRRKKVWARQKIDLQSWFSPELCFVCDWKTGGYWGDDGQAGLTALFLFWANPELQEVKTVWYYLEKDKKVPDSFTRSDVPRLMERPLDTLGKISNSYKTGEWPKTPGFACKFCGVASCEFRGKKF